MESIHQSSRLCVNHWWMNWFGEVKWFGPITTKQQLLRCNIYEKHNIFHWSVVAITLYIMDMELYTVLKTLPSTPIWTQNLHVPLKPALTSFLFPILENLFKSVYAARIYVQIIMWKHVMLMNIVCSCYFMPLYLILVLSP